MPLLFAPSNEMVEVKLGPIVKSWNPRPLADVDKEARGHGNGLRLCFLMAVSFLLAIVIAGIVGRLTGHALLVVVSGIGSLAVMFFGIIKLENNIYNSKRLGIFERGMRYGKFIVPFDELKLISFGAPKTFSEKHLPTLEKHSGSRVPEAKELVRWGRQTALTIHLNNGKLLVWLAFGPVFGKEVLEEFLSMIDERAHAQLRGTSLTDEERRQIEAL
jgi:hypothetical protein